MPVATVRPAIRNEIILKDYKVSKKPDSLRLRLHGENYFLFRKEEIRQKINYGKLMHEVFEGIDQKEDIPRILKRLIIEGKLSVSESDVLEKKIMSLISSLPVSEWFDKGNRVMREAEIILPSGKTRRPDRIILRNDRTVLIDFKFGEENAHYAGQLREYREILLKMGYKNIDSFIWYVDNNKIVTV